MSDSKKILVEMFSDNSFGLRMKNVDADELVMAIKMLISFVTKKLDEGIDDPMEKTFARIHFISDIAEALDANKLEVDKEVSREMYEKIKQLEKLL